MIVKVNRSISVGYMLLINFEGKDVPSIFATNICHNVTIYAHLCISISLVVCVIVVSYWDYDSHQHTSTRSLLTYVIYVHFILKKKTNCLKINVHVQLSCFGSSLLPRSYSGYGLSIRYPMDYPSGIHGYDYWIIHSFYYHNPYMIAY